MATKDIVNPVQNISYTNKDFQSIWVELLDLVKNLTSEWDPSISNDSDPGVILLKLNAIIADKCNYTVDKNVLETFPLSVTQYPNARQLFEQLGYYMPWYKSATTRINLQWIDKNMLADVNYQLPKFTMVSNSAGDIVYCLVDEGMTIDGSGKSSTTYNAIQGIATNYDINGETNITYDLLDNQNRIYITTTDIPENGIFITNSEYTNYDEWQRKDNLLVESLGNYYYKFGLTKDGMSCFIEFPEDAEQLIGQGIKIVYLQTAGALGNVPVGRINRFYQDLTISTDDGSNVTLNSSNVSITNVESATNGADIANINDSYKNYQRTIGTFNTLVTLRDYINYILSSNILASNGFVCDRTNDIQLTYQVMTTKSGVNQLNTKIEKSSIEHPVSYIDEEGKPHDVVYTTDEISMNPYNLKLYLLQYSDASDSWSTYNSTFTMLNNAQQQPTKSYIEELKSIQHDYLDLVEPDFMHDKSHICFFKNVYEIECDITTTQVRLTDSIKDSIKEDIKKNLYTVLNAKEISFGETISRDLIRDTIKNATNTIKSVDITNIKYDTYAVYYQKGGHDLEGYDDYFIESLISDENYIHTTSKNYTADVNIEKFKWSLLPSGRIVGYRQCQFICSHVDSNGLTWKLDDNVVSLADYGITTTATIYNAHVGDIITVDSAKEIIRSEIFAKSVLAGVTPILVQDTNYAYSLNQETCSSKTHASFNSSTTYTIGDIVNYNNHIYVCIQDTSLGVWNPSDWELYEGFIKNIAKISSHVDINLYQHDTDKKINYTLRDNENLQFYAPNLLETIIYSNYVKFEYKINVGVEANSNYQLRDTEYINLYWKQEDEYLEIYQYASYGPGTIICPSFDMPARVDDDKNIGKSLVSRQTNIGTDISPYFYSDSKRDGNMPSDMSIAINELYDAAGLLSGSKTLSTKEINKIELDGSYKFYWILNDYEVISEANNIKRYVLFDYGEGVDTPRLLKAGEYFIYTSSYFSDIHILGAGTEIWRTNSDTVWSVPVVNSTDILTNGLSALGEGDTFRINDGSSAIVIENQYLTLGSGCQIEILPSDFRHTSAFEFTDVYNIGVSFDTEMISGKDGIDRWILMNGEDTGIFGDIIYDKVYDLFDTKVTYKIDDVVIYNSKVYICASPTGPGNWDSSKWTLDNTKKAYDWIYKKPLEDAVINPYDYGLIITSTPIAGKSKFKVKVSKDWSLHINDEGTLLEYYDVRYKTDSNSDWVSISSLNLNDDYSRWKVRSLLNMVCSNQDSQILLDGQSITCYQVNAQLSSSDITRYNKITINGKDYDPINNVYPVSFMSSAAMDLDGGELMSTIIYKEEETQLLDLYTFAEYLNNQAQGIVYNDLGGVTFTYMTRSKYDETKNYYIGDEVEYNDNCYRCVVTSIAGEWDPTKWVWIGGHSQTIEFNLPKGSYLLPLINNYPDIEKDNLQVWFWQGDDEPTELKPIYEDYLYSTYGYLSQFTHKFLGKYTHKQLTTHFIEYEPTNSDNIPSNEELYPYYIPGTYPLYIQELDPTKGICHLRIDCKGTQPNTFITISECYKFDKPDYLTEDQYNYILNTVHKYNYDKDYNYTYKIPDDNKIVNPLQAESFLNPNHIYNRYTICQLSPVYNNNLNISER